ncbi:MAG: FtsQ-type POTRA domain-containing protein [Gallionellaceae bacterium]|nr:MAG: FtsQ-type POTRA domain-containing protein [Gallionellaceae bacterium]
MWDNAQQLRTTANLLFGISLVLVLYGTARYVLRLPAFQLNAVQLSAAPQQVPVELIGRVVREQVRGNFFTVDLNRTRLAFEQLPWVRKVSVRRKFPWMLEVEVEEHVALARWNGTALVNTHGEVFAAITERELPVFIGRANTAAQITEMYGELGKTLPPLRQQIAQISLSPRFAWQVRLSNGMVLELGREQMQQRMARFVDVYPYSLATLPGAAMHVDLRYRNGFAAYLPNGARAQGKQASGNKV